MANMRVIVDIGSATVKVGFSTDQEPTLFIEPLVGIERLPNITGYIKKATIGSVVKKNLTLQKIFPIQRGEILDVDSLVKIFEYIYEKLFEMRIQPDMFPIILCQNTLSMTSKTEDFIMAMLEKFPIKELYCGDNAKFAALALGKDCALVLQSGHGTTECIPVYSGYSIRNTNHKIDFAGYDIDEQVKQFLNEKKQPVLTDNDVANVQKIKETHCRVLYGEERLNVPGVEVTADLKLSHGCSYSLRDKMLTIAEQLFKSESHQGVQELLLDVFNNCDEQIKGDLIKNVILNGGTTLLSGFAERLAEEIAPHRNDVEIISVPNRKYLWFTGASKFAIDNTIWLTKSDIVEYGKRRIYEKFI